MISKTERGLTATQGRRSNNVFGNQKNGSGVHRKEKAERHRSGELDIYLETISTHDLLTPEQECEAGTIIQAYWDGLAEKIHNLPPDLEKKFQEIIQEAKPRSVNQGRLGAITWESELRCYHWVEGVLTDKERRSLNPNKADYSRARDLLINSNLRLVIAVARGYQGKGVALGDLIQEGNLGLIRASDTYEPKFRFKFSTYATPYIKVGIRNAITEQTRMLHVPRYILELRWKLSKELQRRDLLDKPESWEEVAKEIMDEKQFSRGKKEKIIRKIIQPEMIIHSLSNADGEVSDYGNRTVRGNGKTDTMKLEDHRVSTEDYFEKDNRDHIVERVRVAVEEDLEQHERTVMTLRFGLDGEAPLTLQEIGEMLGVRRERIRQIEAEAIEKLNEGPLEKEFLQLLLG